MKTTHKVSVQKLASAALALLTLFVARAPGAMARPRTAKQPATVIGHLLLPGAAVRQMFVEERGSKQYLYIEQASQEGFVIIDVTKPSQPKFIQQVAWPNQASAGKLQMIGAGLALAIAADGDTGRIGRDYATQSVKVLDLTDPANPQTLQSFPGVTSMVADEGRDLIYITNSEGLWILKQKQQPEPRQWDN
ncbi:MAG TPA: hypothetical protein VKE24_01685 [Candidatus Acidoferrales bacterium]|nr:hypothetical protein [Candidatus Acidoferrales bacterium]